MYSLRSFIWVVTPLGFVYNNNNTNSTIWMYGRGLSREWSQLSFEWSHLSFRLQGNKVSSTNSGIEVSFECIPFDGWGIGSPARLSSNFGSQILASGKKRLKDCKKNSKQNSNFLFLRIMVRTPKFFCAWYVTLHLELLEKCPLSGLERCSRKSVSWNNWSADQLRV